MSTYGQEAALEWLAARLARAELGEEKGIAVFELRHGDVLTQPLERSNEVERYGLTEENLIKKLRAAFPNEMVTRPDGKLSLCDSRQAEGDIRQADGEVDFHVRLPALVITALSEAKDSLLAVRAASRTRARAAAATPEADD